MKAHGLLEGIGRGYRYRLTDKGVKAALMFILFHKRVCGPLRRQDRRRYCAKTFRTAMRSPASSASCVMPAQCGVITMFASFVNG
jgi:hypothetical protein